MKNQSDELAIKTSTPKTDRVTQTHISLKELEVGQAAQIIGFLNHDDAIKKIEAMGLRKGKRITVLRKLGRGILIRTSNLRIVITSDVAKNIEVK